MAGGDMSKQDILTTVRERLAKASPGPWRSPWDAPDSEEEPTFVDADGEAVVSVAWHDGHHLAVSKDNASLIANAPTDIQALLAEVERLQRALAATSRGSALRSARRCWRGPHKAAAARGGA